MTGKEYSRIWFAIILLAVGIFCLAVGGLIVSLRYDVEIRNDQVELKAKVEAIEKDKVVFDDLKRKLILIIEEVKLERQRLHELQLKLSKGE